MVHEGVNYLLLSPAFAKMIPQFRANWDQLIVHLLLPELELNNSSNKLQVFRAILSLEKIKTSCEDYYQKRNCEITPRLSITDLKNQFECKFIELGLKRAIVI